MKALKMAGKNQYTAAQMIEALQKSNGMITYAADYLGCAYNTVRRYIDNYPTVKEAFEDSKTRMGDRVESTLYTIAVGKPTRDGKGWEIEPNVTALIFLAKTHPAMRQRGYAERKEFANATDEAGNVEPFEVKFTYPEGVDDDATD